MGWGKLDTDEIMNQNISDDPLQIYLQIFLYIFITLSVVFIVYVFLGIIRTITKGIFSNILEKKKNQQILKDNTTTNTLFFQRNKKWVQDKNNYITINDDIGYGSLKGVIFGVFFLGIGILIYYKVMTYFGIFFSLFGIIFLIQTMFIEYSKNKYKQIDLKLYKPSTVLGNVLRGYVIIDKPIENTQFLITLENIHFYQARRASGEDINETVNRESIVSSKTVKGYVKNNISNTEVYFNIDISKEGYPSGRLNGAIDEGYYWILSIKESRKLSILKRIYTIYIEGK
jgi:hypothetical protein